MSETVRQSPTASAASDIAKAVQAANRQDSLWTRVTRTANILRYYRTSQLARRVLKVVTSQGRAQGIRSTTGHDSILLRKAGLEKFRQIAATRSVRTASNLGGLLTNLAAGRFKLLNQELDLGSPIDWQGDRAAHPSRLWSFQLHYHDYLLDLAAGPNSTNTDPVDADPWPTIWSTIVDWIDQNPQAQASINGNAWHPFCISRRLPVWAQLLATNSPPKEIRERILQSYAAQAEVLCDHLEFDLGGNHLLENLHALIVSAVLLEGSVTQKWLNVARQYLPQQISQQVLEHGEHYERAPMYHCQVLGNMLQSVFLLANIDDNLASTCRSYAARMLNFLTDILHPDGEIPLFGDSCHGESYSAAEIHQLAKLSKLETKVQSDQGSHVVGPYWVWRDGQDALIFDTGPVGADDLPAHAHCDLLNFEASINGTRWIVDSGLFDYEEGAMRAYCRSSAAHNVATLGLLNTCDVWSRFRMGRRGRPLQFEAGQDGDFSWCRAGHDGYRHLGIPEISRLMLTHPCGAWVCLDAAIGDLPEPLVGRLHLGPDVQIVEHQSDRILLSVGNVQRWLLPTPGVMLELSEGWHCNRFGVRQRISVINYRQLGTENMGRPIGWSLSPTNVTQIDVSTTGDSSCHVQVATEDFSDKFTKQL